MNKRQWKKRAKSAERQIEQQIEQTQRVSWSLNWKDRALQAERQLKRDKASTMEVRVMINGKVKARYPITAHRLECNLPPDFERIWASGSGAVFTLDIPVEIS